MVLGKRFKGQRLGAKGLAAPPEVTSCLVEGTQDAINNRIKSRNNRSTFERCFSEDLSAFREKICGIGGQFNDRQEKSEIYFFDFAWSARNCSKPIFVRG
jgi:hypothetical protein